MARSKLRTIGDIPEAVKQARNLIIANTPTLKTQKGLINIVQNFVPEATTLTASTIRSSATIVTPLNTNITTKGDNSKIQYDLVLSGEIDNNAVFFLQRVINGVATELGSTNSATAGSRLYGFSSANYDQNNDSTPSQICCWTYIDSLTAPVGTLITYRVLFYAPTAVVLYLNRSVIAGTDYPYERCSSNVILSEYGV